MTPLWITWNPRTELNGTKFTIGKPTGTPTMPLNLSFSEAELPRYSHAMTDTERREAERARKAKHEAKRAKRSRTIDPREKRIIAWDGEGMKLSGSKAPQHYVLFGCSADVENPLII